MEHSRGDRTYRTRDCRAREAARAPAAPPDTVPSHTERLVADAPAVVYVDKAPAK